MRELAHVPRAAFTGGVKTTRTVAETRSPVRFTLLGSMETTLPLYVLPMSFHFCACASGAMDASINAPRRNDRMDSSD